MTLTQPTQPEEGIMFAHRFTYDQRRLQPTQTHRYTDERQRLLIIESHYANFQRVADWPTRWNDEFGVHAAVDEDGRDCWIIKRRNVAGGLTLAGTRGDERTYRPASEWHHCGGHVYSTVEDALVAARDERAVEAEWQRVAQMMAAAETAAAGHGSTDGGYSRAAYEAACHAAGVDAIDDAEAVQHDRSGGVFSVPEYHPEHIVWVQLVRRLVRGIEAGRALAEETAQAAADQIGDGPYDRAAYEAACAAAGVDPLPDDVVPQVAETVALARHQPVRDVLTEMAVDDALGALPAVAARLAARRTAGQRAELVELRSREREELAAAGRRFASPVQVDQIMDLLGQRRRTGEGGGFFSGPTDRAGVANLSGEDAASYVQSLRGDY